MIRVRCHNVLLILVRIVVVPISNVKVNEPHFDIANLNVSVAHGMLLPVLQANPTKVQIAVLTFDFVASVGLLEILATVRTRPHMADQKGKNSHGIVGNFGAFLAPLFPQEAGDWGMSH